MNENVMSQLDAELEHAGEETALSPQMLLLEQLRITPEKELPRMDFLFRLFGKPCFPRRELVAITGKAKSGKTFVTSMLMAKSLSPDRASPPNPLSKGRGGMPAAREGSMCQLPLQRMREKPLRVLWYDTEQSDESTQDILRNRIMKLAADKHGVARTSDLSATDKHGVARNSDLLAADKHGLARTELFDAENNSCNSLSKEKVRESPCQSDAISATDKHGVARNSDLLAADKHGLTRTDLFDAENNSCNLCNSLSKEKVRESPCQSDAIFDVFNVRAVEWKQRRALLTEAVRRCRPDLVIVDGIRDLVNDINDGVLAQEVMEELLHLATQAECCIVCVLHQNKSGEDRNLRGWIGTELMNKAFEVYSCEKMMPQRVFKLEQTLTRKYDIEQTMYFEVGEDGLPRGASPNPIPERSSPTRSLSQGGEVGHQERLPPLNRDYILPEVDDKGKCLFDVPKLFLAAMNGEAEVGGAELRKRVMELANIVQYRKYNDLLKQATEQKVIVRMERNHLTFYGPAPF